LAVAAGGAQRSGDLLKIVSVWCPEKKPEIVVSSRRVLAF